MDTALVVFVTWTLAKLRFGLAHTAGVNRAFSNLTGNEGMINGRICPCFILLLESVVATFLSVPFFCLI